MARYVKMLDGSFASEREAGDYMPNGMFVNMGRHAPRAPKQHELRMVVNGEVLTGEQWRAKGSPLGGKIMTLDELRALQASTLVSKKKNN